MLPRLLLISATAIAAGAVYTTMVPQSQVNLNEPCRAEALHGTQITYENNCPRYQSTGSGSTSRSIGRSFRGGGPGSGK
jgi:hypothetical protein